MKTRRVKRYSLAEQATDITREDILSGQLEPGTKLTERGLAETLDISQAPAREALQQLEREGLLIMRGDGRYVFEWTAQDVLDVNEIRLPLEELAAARTAGRMTPEIAAELRARLEQLRQAITAQDIDAFFARDGELHRAIWSHSGNPRLFQMLDALVGPKWIFPHDQSDRREENQAFWDAQMENHEALVDSILSGDPAAAREGVERHMGVALRQTLHPLGLLDHSSRDCVDGN